MIRKYLLVNNKHLQLQLFLIQFLTVTLADSSNFVIMAENATQSAARNQIAGKMWNGILFPFQLICTIKSPQLQSDVKISIQLSQFDFISSKLIAMFQSDWISKTSQGDWDFTHFSLQATVDLDQWKFAYRSYTICVIYWSSQAHDN